MASPNNQDRFPDWDNLYKQEVKTMPWYNEQLDIDLEKIIKQRKFTKGRFLDLGTGPGTQAIQLAKLGFDVTGTDLSENAIKKARELDNSVNFMVDDILHSKLNTTFDYILDRGCFHVLPPDKWNQYTRKIYEMLDSNGLFFLKCFSKQEKKLTYGPYLFSEQDLRNIFGKEFVIESIIDTEYQGTLETFPKALFVIMSKKK